MGQVYTAKMEAVTHQTSMSSLFSIKAHSSMAVRIREIVLGQTSDVGDAASEILQVRLVSTTSATATDGGTRVTPRPVRPGARASGTTIATQSTWVEAATQGGFVQYCDAMNVMAGWQYRPADPDTTIWVEKGKKLLVVVSAPADALTMNGTITFEEHTFNS